MRPNRGEFQSFYQVCRSNGLGDPSISFKATNLMKWIGSIIDGAVGQPVSLDWAVA